MIIHTSYFTDVPVALRLFCFLGLVPKDASRLLVNMPRLILRVASRAVRSNRRRTMTFVWRTVGHQESRTAKGVCIFRQLPRYSAQVRCIMIGTILLVSTRNHGGTIMN